MPFFLSLLVLWLLILALPASALITPASIFTDGCVLQRGMPVPVWGTAPSGERISVSINGQEASTVSEGGRWMVRLEDMKAGGPYTLTIKGKDETIILRDVLVGEVWIGSGQSNMEWPMMWAADGDKDIADANDPQLRLFTVPKRVVNSPVSDIESSWKSCTPENVKPFSAVAYHFGRSLRAALKVPVGLIHSSWGGTRAETWTPISSMEANPALRHHVDLFNAQIADYRAKLKLYREKKLEGKEMDLKPPENPWRDHQAPGCLYNGMISPLIPYAFKGVIWYQGESNVESWQEYHIPMSTLIRSWRKNWGQGDFPFLMVELAPFGGHAAQFGVHRWPMLREAQWKVGSTEPKVAVTCIMDAGECKDIHPKNKRVVGERLALAAKAIGYDIPSVYSGPVFNKVRITGDKAVVSFKHADGLNGDPKGFEIAGDDGKYVAAQAKIVDERVEVWSDAVKSPKSVRYGWEDCPDICLFNESGLPASPFRTDSAR